MKTSELRNLLNKFKKNKVTKNIKHRIIIELRSHDQKTAYNWFWQKGVSLENRIGYNIIEN